jgi:WD40 repeat protein
VQYALTGHTARINSLNFSNDGKYLYSSSLDGKVLKWDLAKRTGTNIVTGGYIINSIDISSEDQYMAGITSDGKVIVWMPGNGSDYFLVETSGNNKVIRFEPHSNILAIGNSEGTVELWDIKSRVKISDLKAHTAQVNDIQFNPVLRQMATAGNDKCLKIFNIKDVTSFTEPPITFTDNDGFVTEMKFNPSGQLIVSGTYEGEKNLVSRPVHADFIARDICTLVTRNMTRAEWNTYVGLDIPYDSTCPGADIKIKIREVRK